jgi:hypothetical protein
VTASTVPAFLDALMARLRDALPGVQVIDSHPGDRRDIADEVIIVGFTGTPGEAAVLDTRTIEQVTRDPDRESYDVTSIASVSTGDADDDAVKRVRERTYQLVDAVAELLAADQTLGGAVMAARVSADELAQAITDGGAYAAVRFTVHVDAYTS